MQTKQPGEPPGEKWTAALGRGQGENEWYVRRGICPRQPGSGRSPGVLGAVRAAQAKAANGFSALF